MMMMMMKMCVGLVLALELLLGAAQGRSFYVSEKMNSDIERLVEPLGLKDNALGQNPIFTNLLRNNTYEEQDQKLLLNATLDAYVRILSSMLQRVKSGGQVEASLRSLMMSVKDLKRHFYKDRDHHLRTQLQRLANIKVDDEVVQKKALNELKEVFKRASALGVTRQD